MGNSPLKKRKICLFLIAYDRPILTSHFVLGATYYGMHYYDADASTMFYTNYTDFSYV
jgi:hypothetical protein